MSSPVIEKDSDLYWHVRSIVDDQDRGAAAIGKDLRKHLVPFAGDKREGAEIARMLVDAKPVMSPILHVANHLFGGPEPPLATEGLGASGLALVSPDRPKGERRGPVVEDAVDRILRSTKARPISIMTYSASGTVEAVLDAVQELGLLKEVYLSEAQPGGEGRSLAARLAAEWGPRDAEVFLTHDAALPALLPHVDVFLIGADLALPDGLVNKVGTATLVERAQRLGKPVIVAAGPDKAPPQGVKAHHLPLPLSTTAGQLSDPPTGVHTVGLAFEWVDLTDSRSMPEWITEPKSPKAEPDLIGALQSVKTERTTVR